jgi:hypothetical protein
MAAEAALPCDTSDPRGWIHLGSIAERANPTVAKRYTWSKIFSVDFKRCLVRSSGICPKTGHFPNPGISLNHYISMTYRIQKEIPFPFPEVSR